MTAKNEVEAYKLRLRSDFTFFLKELWHFTGLDKKAPLEELHLDMAEWIDCREQATRGIMAPRGVGKTTIGTSAYAAFRLLGEPDMRIMVVSEGDSHAKSIVGQVRDWIRTIPFLQHLAPNADLRHYDNAHGFHVGPTKYSKDPSVRAAGIGGQITGTRAGLLIADDIETSRSADTVNSREKIDKAVKEFRAICSFGRKEILYVGTPHHRECLYDKLMKRGDGGEHSYVFRVYPIMLPKPAWRHPSIAPIVQRKLDEYGPVGDNTIVPLFPVNLGRDHIHAQMAEGLVEFTRQHMCVADAEDLEYPLRLADLIVPSCGVDMLTAPVWIKHGLRTGQNESTAWGDMALLGGGNDRLHREIGFAQESAPYMQTMGFIDTSGRGKDETAWCIGGYLAGYIWTKKLGHSNEGEPGDGPGVMARIAHDAREARCHRLVVEAQFGGDSFAKLLEVELRRLALEPGKHPEYPDGWRCSVESVPSRGRKEKRIISALSRVMHAHRLVVPRSILEIEPDVPMQYQLQYQIANITEKVGSIAHDDRVEALAGMVGLLSANLDVSPEDMAKLIEQREIEAQAEAFHEIASKQYPGLYAPLKKPSWITN